MRFSHFFLLLLGGLLAGAPAARAQDKDSTSVAPPVAEAVAPPDTAAALHRLFAAKRGLRVTVVLGTVLAGGLGLVLDGALASDSRNGLSDLAIKSRIVAATALFALVEVLAHNRYNRKEEQLALAAWRAHRLAPELRRKLTPHYFAPNPPPTP